MIVKCSGLGWERRRKCRGSRVGGNCWCRIWRGIGDAMKLSLPSLGKSKKQGNGAVDEPGIVSLKEGKVGKKGKEGKQGKEEKQGFMAKITSRASSKSKKGKSGRVENGGVTGVAGSEPALHVSKTDEELKAAFRVYDVDNDGRISNAELRKVLTSLGGEISDGEVQELMKQIDKDNDGFISVAEFIEFHQTSAVSSVGVEASSVLDPMRAAFQMFDLDGDSKISARELQSVLVSLGDKGHSLEKCKQMISSVDKDGDGFVDFMEFQELMGGQ
ncbi:hypothetical protein KC19_1G300000 [Ceratodon purpureus]|uniref:EF-hand domain-containing protein n=1 Tax=Ceratodon purpureus TaxID=3225 RepID=A0A8T0JDA0_CERPU|nr:hypothetical protein KC19_1G300000 [Ceratodon purpureus]